MCVEAGYIGGLLGLCKVCGACEGAGWVPLLVGVSGLERISDGGGLGEWRSGVDEGSHNKLRTFSSMEAIRCNRSL